jgi:hypothetical protein
VVTRVYVWGEIGMGRRGEVNPNLYRVWEESGRVKIQIRGKI